MPKKLDDQQRRLFQCLGTQLKLLGEVVGEIASDSGEVGHALKSLELCNAALIANSETDQTPSAVPSRQPAYKRQSSVTAVSAEHRTIAVKIPPPAEQSAEAFAPEASIGFPVIESDDKILSSDISLPSRLSTNSGESCGICEGPAWRRSLRNLVATSAFDVAIGVVIILNAATIGVEISMNSEEKDVPGIVKTFDFSFLVVYILELVLRLTAFGCRAFQSHWVKFDAFLVISGIFDIISEELLVNRELAEDNLILTLLGNMMVVRMFRLVRLARLVKLMVKFRVLFLLIQGLIESLYTIIWTFVVVAILLYIFACLGMELLRPDDNMPEDYNESVRNNFGNLQNAFLTLLMGLTLDSLGSIYRPIIIAKPFMFLYFIAFILIVSISLMNLVTALMVESAIQQAENDKELQKEQEVSKKKKTADELKQIFYQLDLDNSGELSLDELTNSPLEVRERLTTLLNSDDPDELVIIFHTLDYDNSGSVGIDEFITGLSRVLDGKPMEITCLLVMCREMVHIARGIHAKIHDSRLVRAA